MLISEVGRVVASRFLRPGLGDGQICFRFSLGRRSPQQAFSSPPDDFDNAFSLVSARQLLSSVSSQQRQSPSPSSPPLPTRTSISPASTLHLSSPDFVSTPSSEHHS
ncbi:hypothetical protein I308_100831 [Cryptococcus tetragattii IND107]|uniref:Uncharacterized protein n=1 Tax=Cryptococcus tetragattii IND107 TaxID=1296105 RepID=A0ABR3C5W7_9TREE